MKAYVAKSGKTQYKASAKAVMAAAEASDGTGWCLACGAENDGCEPDMRKGVCQACDAAKVYGAEELLLMGLVH